jgi:hypothetical protein
MPQAVRLWVVLQSVNLLPGRFAAAPLGRRLGL